MQLKNTLTRYGAVAQLFHWVIVVLIITQFVLAKRAEGLSPVAQDRHPRPRTSPSASRSWASRCCGSRGGCSIRSRRCRPATPRWQELAAHVSHFLLYALLFITPVLGWLMSSARNFSVSWLGLVTLPDFIEPNKAAYERLHDCARGHGVDAGGARAGAHRGRAQASLLRSRQRAAPDAAAARPRPTFLTHLPNHRSDTTMTSPHHAQTSATRATCSSWSWSAAASHSPPRSGPCSRRKAN